MPNGMIRKFFAATFIVAAVAGGAAVAVAPAASASVSPVSNSDCMFHHNSPGC